MSSSTVLECVRERIYSIMGVRVAMDSTISFVHCHMKSTLRFLRLAASVRLVEHEKTDTEDEEEANITASRTIKERERESE